MHPAVGIPRRHAPRVAVHAPGAPTAAKLQCARMSVECHDTRRFTNVDHSHTRTVSRWMRVVAKEEVSCEADSVATGTFFLWLKMLNYIFTRRLRANCHQSYELGNAQLISYGVRCSVPFRCARPRAPTRPEPRGSGLARGLLALQGPRPLPIIKRDLPCSARVHSGEGDVRASLSFCGDDEMSLFA